MNPLYSITLILLALANVAQAFVLNNPYPAAQSEESIFYSSFGEQPKTLDPARSYSANEFQFTTQIYESLLEYHYLKRPYTLVPQSTLSLPDVRCFDKSGRTVRDCQGEVAFTTYRFSLKPDVLYQPHPALAKNRYGLYRYHHLSSHFLDDHGIRQLSDFKYTGTRPRTADDYIYQIKRMALPQNACPVFGLLAEYIVGFKQYYQQFSGQTITPQMLQKHDMEGLKRLDDTHFDLTTKGYYPQLIYWFAMPFFSPIPWEVEVFYSQPDMEDRNLNLSWYPIGTGPFMLTQNNPNSSMILEKNPNFTRYVFTEKPSKSDLEKGYTHFLTEPLPIVDKAIFRLEKESIPRWSKFMQGYYDTSGVSADSFDQAIRLDKRGEPLLTDSMKERGITLVKTVDPSVYYVGFNMLDPVVGGSSKRAVFLRRAISIAFDIEEEISIFFNGRGMPAFGPIPPGIFGYVDAPEGINPYVYRLQNGIPERRSIQEARTWLAKAGYVNGIDSKTGRPLLLHYDVPISGGPDDKALLQWVIKQFAKLGIALDVRATQYNQFQDKMQSGNAQIYTWGWNADYPDPENFLFQLYGPNGKVAHGGENASNYRNARFDALFERMKNMPNTEERGRIIQKMIRIVQADAPWIWGINPETLILRHNWMSPIKPSAFRLNTLEYAHINVALRNYSRILWNQAVLWPLLLMFILCIFLCAPVWYLYRRHERQTVRRA